MSDLQIAVAAASFAYAFPTQILAQIKINLKPGVTVLQCSTAGMADTEKKRLDIILQKAKPIALIGIAIRPDSSTVAAYKAANAPVVLIDEEMDGVSTVTSDNFAGGYLAGSFLASRGRKRMAVVSGRMDVEGGYNATQRVKGFSKALAENGITLAEEDLAEVVDYSYKNGIDALTHLLQGGKELDAVFCAAGDVCAAGLLRAAREHKKQVPKDIAIIGYDDMDVARISWPSLTTVRQPIKEIADTVYRLAVTEHAETLSSPKKIAYKPELVVRDSA